VQRPSRRLAAPAQIVLACLLTAACGFESLNATPVTTSDQPALTSAGSTEPSGSATTNASPSGSRPLTSRALRDVVRAESIRTHLVQLRHIADEHGGNRAAGTPGYDASVDYVASRLEAAGYVIERQAFPLPADAGTSVNVIAEMAGWDGAEVVMLGAHLDSIRDGPGINDNGSGSMTLLALAEQLAGFDRPRRTVRFAFWGAEELGQIGSSAYVASLASDERQRLQAYLNFDMLGSPNYVRFVYADQRAAQGSEAITRLLASHLEAEGLAWWPIDLSGKSDHGPFALAGIPTGGLFSGGREDKTDAQADALGGTAGEPADPCSHRACDTIAKVSDDVLDEMADAIAHALVALAGS